jgi:hypothetical protein
MEGAAYRLKGERGIGIGTSAAHQAPARRGILSRRPRLNPIEMLCKGRGVPLFVKAKLRRTTSSHTLAKAIEESGQHVPEELAHEIAQLRQAAVPYLGKVSR